MNASRSLHDRLGAIIDQVGQPDYSVRELIDGLREIRDELYAVSESAATVQVDLGALEELSLMAAISTADPTIDELERILDAIGDRVEELIAGRQSPPSATGPMFDVVQLSEARYYRDHKEPIGILARAILRANGEMK